MKKVDAALDPAKMTAILRAGVLAITPKDIGLSVEACPQVWGMMMELGEAEVVVSLVVLADGSVSIYLSNGEGVIGCGLHPEVRSAAAKTLRAAEQMVDRCVSVSSYPAPAEDQVCFYLLTSHGILKAEALRAELDEGAVELAELYYAGHGVIGIVELLGAGVDLVNEMQLAKGAAAYELQVAKLDGTYNTELARQSVQEFKARGRGCRILPYVGTVARRSRN